MSYRATCPYCGLEFSEVSSAIGHEHTGCDVDDMWRQYYAEHESRMDKAEHPATEET